MSRASTQRDKPGGIDIPNPMYEGTRTCEHGKMVPYHLIQKPVLPDGHVLFLEMVEMLSHPGPEDNHLRWAFHELHSDQGKEFRVTDSG